MSLKYLTRRAAINAATRNPSLTNLNHLRNFPRSWLVRRTKHDPRLKSVRPSDRIKCWNIVPGDQIRLRGDEEETIHEVLSINRLSNRVFVKGPSGQSTKDGQPPPSRNHHYSKCQLYIGEYDVKSPSGDLQPQPVFAARVASTAAKWDHFFKRFSWRRYATSTVPRLPNWHRGMKVRIPWPSNEKRSYPEPTLYDTQRDEVARVTYELPAFEPVRGGGPLKAASETEYFNIIYNRHKNVDYDPSLPVEIFLEKELANPHSRAKKMERYKQHQARIQDTLKRITEAELKEPDGRTVRQIKADAAFKWRELVKSEQRKEKKARWAHTARVAEWKRKASNVTKKEERQRRRLTELVLRDEPNQVLPKTL